MIPVIDLRTLHEFLIMLYDVLEVGVEREEGKECCRGFFWRQFWMMLFEPVTRLLEVMLRLLNMLTRWKNSGLKQLM